MKFRQLVHRIARAPHDASNNPIWVGALSRGAPHRCRGTGCAQSSTGSTSIGAGVFSNSHMRFCSARLPELLLTALPTCAAQCRPGTGDPTHRLHDAYPCTSSTPDLPPLAGAHPALSRGPSRTRRRSERLQRLGRGVKVCGISGAETARRIIRERTRPGIRLVQHPRTRCKQARLAALFISAVSATSPDSHVVRFRLFELPEQIE